MIGLSPIEAVPIYHYMPGSRAARILLTPATSLECKHDNFEVCDWAKGPEAYPGVYIETSLLIDILNKWSFDVIVLDGIEPLLEAGRVIDHSVFGKPICARSQGLSRVNPPEWLSCMLLEDLSLITRESLTPSHLEDILVKSLSSGIHVELAVYAEEAETLLAHKTLLLSSEYRIPVHVLLPSIPAWSAKRLYDELRRINPHVYIHTESFQELDTYCEKCGVILAQRTRVGLLSIITSDKCPQCGHSLPFKNKPLKIDWRRGVLRVFRGKPLWFNPLTLIYSGEWRERDWVKTKNTMEEGVYTE